MMIPNALIDDTKVFHMAAQLFPCFCSYVAKIFGHALEDSHSKSGLVHSLSVCTSLLDPRRSAVSSSMFNSYRGQHMFESPVPVSPETIGAMLPKLSKLDPMMHHRHMTIKIINFLAFLFVACT